MKFTYTAHAEIKLSERNITKRQVQESFHHYEAEAIHGGLSQKTMVVDGLEIRVVYKRLRKEYRVITVHHIDE